ncbi:MAG: RimK family alpha-L-glutamate ligase, partial [Cellulosilyticaceae bacterium]
MNRKHGYVITNGYINNQKFNEVTQLYIEAADKLNIKLESITTDEITYGIDKGEVSVKGFDYELGDFIIFLDKDIRLAKTLESKGIRLFNSSSVIEVCDDKSATFFALAGGGIAMPKTVVAPLVFPRTYQEEDAFIQLVEKELTYPFIIKESFGSFGEQVYMVHNLEELKAKRKELAYMPHIYQEFVT